MTANTGAIGSSGSGGSSGSSGASAASLLERDEAARRAAQVVFDRPIVLEAGAGTGKTATLVARMLAWMLGAGWQAVLDESDVDEASLEDERIAGRVLDGVVAITFTEAAAAEMAQRLGRRLAEIARTGSTKAPGFDATLLQPEQLPAEEMAARARALLGCLERVTVCTIHAFCNLLLRRHALALGLHPDFVIDAREDLTEEAAREVVERGSRSAYAEREIAPLVELAGRGTGPHRLVEAVTRFVLEGTPGETFAESLFTQRAIEDLRKELAEACREMLESSGESLRQIGASDRPRRIALALEATLGLLDGLSSEPLAAVRALATGLGEIWEAPLLDRLGDWRKEKFLVAERSAFGDDAPRITDLARRLDCLGHLANLDPEFVELARRTIHGLVVETERLLQVRGIATFQALLVDTRRLLSDSRIRAKERGRIRQLLVDEFQDTDEVQCDIVRFLALDGDKQSRPGLFVVGDPKQSIYAWRNADLAAYEGLVGLALDAGGERHPLIRNFRSAPEILAEVERAIAPVMDEEAGLQPPFETLLPGDPERNEAGGLPADRSHVEYWSSWDRDSIAKGRTPTARSAEIEAEAIARDVRRLHNENGVPWNEFALLFRSTNRLDEYLEAFRAGGIPFAVTSDKQYYRRREVIEAAALVRAIVDPLDHIALLTFLRSVVVGVPDAALIPLWKQGLPGLLTELDGAEEEADAERLAAIESAVRTAAEDLPESVPLLRSVAHWPDGLIAAARDLAQLRHSFATEPVDRFVERLRSTLLLEAAESARYLGAYRVANLERFFRRLEDGLATGHGEISSILRALRRSVAEAREDEEALPKEAAEDAVQVMTIHKAKGLEFGHVYVVQLHAGARRSEHDANDADRRPASGNTDEPRQYVLFNRPSLRWDRVEAERVRSAAAEQVRTLYVAMTRAQERLVLIGNWPKTPKPVSPGGGVPAHLKLLAHRAPFPKGMAALAKAIEEPQDGFLDEQGVRWLIPDLIEADQPPEIETTAAASAVTAKQARSWTLRLQADREEAARRMARPLFGSASGKAAAGLDAAHEASPVAPGTLPRAAAREVGRIIHAALEMWDFEAPAEEEWTRRTEWIAQSLPAAVATEHLEHATGWTQQLLARMKAGGLLARLRENAGGIVARELPVLLAADGSGPLHGCTGTIDLLLRGDDPEDILIVDFKTDVVAEDEVERKAALYEPQLDVYRHAVREGLGLERPPRAELWFLWPDRAWAAPPIDNTD